MIDGFAKDVLEDVQQAITVGQNRGGFGQTQPERRADGLNRVPGLCRDIGDGDWFGALASSPD